MKKTKKQSMNRKHIQIRPLNEKELKTTFAGADHITCGLEGDLCRKLSVVTAVNETHKVVLASELS